jgi:hypothetical protein
VTETPSLRAAAFSDVVKCPFSFSIFNITTLISCPLPSVRVVLGMILNSFLALVMGFARNVRSGEGWGSCTYRWLKKVKKRKRPDSESEASLQPYKTFRTNRDSRRRPNLNLVFVGRGQALCSSLRAGRLARPASLRAAPTELKKQKLENPWIRVMMPAWQACAWS